LQGEVGDIGLVEEVLQFRFRLFQQIVVEVQLLQIEAVSLSRFMDPGMLGDVFIGVGVGCQGGESGIGPPEGDVEHVRILDIGYPDGLGEGTDKAFFIERLPVNAEKFQEHVSQRGDDALLFLLPFDILPHPLHDLLGKELPLDQFHLVVDIGRTFLKEDVVIFRAILLHAGELGLAEFDDDLGVRHIEGRYE